MLKMGSIQIFKCFNMNKLYSVKQVQNSNKIQLNNSLNI